MGNGLEATILCEMRVIARATELRIPGKDALGADFSPLGTYL